MVWRMNESIGRIQHAGKPPPGADPMRHGRGPACMPCQRRICNHADGPVCMDVTTAEATRLQLHI